MFYHKEIKIPPNTSERNPLVRRLRVYPGTVTHIWVGFPRMCCGLAHLQIWHHGWQVWPWTAQESYHWDNYVFDIDDEYPLDSEPYEFVIKGWNLDEFYAHSLFFGVTVKHSKSLSEANALTNIMRDLGLLESD